MDPFNREAFLVDLISLDQQQQPSSSSATNLNPLQDSYASSSPAAATTSNSHTSNSASPANAAPHVWDVEALAKMMKSNLPEADDVQDLPLATRHRSMAPSPPAIPSHPGSPGSIYFNYFGTYTPTTATTESAASLASIFSSVPRAPVTEFFIPIPSAPQHRQGLRTPFELTLDHHLDISCGPITTTNSNPNPTSLSNAVVVASPSQPMFDSEDPTPIYQDFPLEQPFDHEFDPMPIETSPFSGASPMASPKSNYQSDFSLRMADLHQQTSSLSSPDFSTPAAAAHSMAFPSPAIPVRSFPLLSLTTPGALVDFGMVYGLNQQTSALSNNENSVTASAASFPSTANHHDNDYSMTVAPGVFNPNSPEHLSDLSNLVQHRQRLLRHQQQQYLQQQQQHQHLRQRVFHHHQQHMTSSPPPSPPLPTPQPLFPCNQLDNNTVNHTSTSHIDNRTNDNTREYSFMRPLNTNSFAQSIPHIEHSTSTNDASSTSLTSSTDTTHHHHQLTTSDFLSMTGATKRRLGRPPLDRMPPTSPTTPITTFSSSSSSSSTSSSTSSRAPSPGVVSNSSSSRQISPKRFYIVEPYQHTDQKVDRRSFNSRKQLRQLQAQEAQAN